MVDATAIAVFVFNRPEHTRLMLQSLSECKNVENYKIFVFQDGPRDDSDVKKIEQVQDVLEGYREALSLQLTAKASNLGLAESVISGVSKVLLNYTSVIVLEDDLVLNPGTLNFLKQAISLMKINSKIFSASAYSPVDMRDSTSYQTKKYDGFLVNRTHSWGWAITATNWSRIDWKLQNLNLALRDRKTLDFFVEGGNDLIPMLVEQLKGSINSWAIRMAIQAAIFREYTLYPSATLIRNVGFDGTGVHCGFNEQIQNQKLDLSFTPDLMRFPPVHCPEVTSKFKQHYGAR